MRYTKRCSKLIRRDQTLESRYLRGSGLPTPLNGCSQTTSTKSKILLILVESFLAHHRRCSLKVGVKIGLQTLFSDKAQILAQVFYRLRLNCSIIHLLGFLYGFE
jgi:hypothetical protein